MTRPSQSRRQSTLFPKYSVVAFAERFDEGRPSWSHGSPTRLGSLRALGQLATLVELAARSRPPLKAMLQGAGGSPAEVPIQARDVLPLYAVGATIAFNDVHRWHAGAASWLARLRADLRLPRDVGGCNLYLSPGDRGVPMHFDDHEIVVVQLTGTKQWRFAPNPTVPYPVHNAGRRLEGPAGDYAVGPPPRTMPQGPSITMRPGSTLFLPRGYWHATRASSLSISITFGLRRPTWLGLLQTALTDLLVCQPEWRQTSPTAQRSPRHQRVAAARWRQLRAKLVEQVSAMPLESLVDPGRQGSRPPGRLR